MKTISQLFDTAFATKARREWDKVYLLFDIHDTLMFGTWSEKRSHEYYPKAIECMQLLSQRDDFCIIQWSSSSPENNLLYKKEFEAKGIRIDYINENPEVLSTDYADFHTKPYMAIGLDDKFGFDPLVDWPELYEYLIKLKEERER